MSRRQRAGRRRRRRALPDIPSRRRRSCTRGRASHRRRPRRRRPAARPACRSRASPVERVLTFVARQGVRGAVELEGATRDPVRVAADDRSEIEAAGVDVLLERREAEHDVARARRPGPERAASGRSPPYVATASSVHALRRTKSSTSVPSGITPNGTRSTWALRASGRRSGCGCPRRRSARSRRRPRSRGSRPRRWRRRARRRGRSAIASSRCTTSCVNVSPQPTMWPGGHQ